MRFKRFSFVVLAAGMIAAGCNERAPRSFVQPNVIKKSDLVGTWHYVQTVTDSPPTNNFTFIGNASELMKIKFDVQENTLFARRAFEQVKGSEDAFTMDPEKYAGQAVAAWPIRSHFDIIRDYNPTTGEETNRIIESTERPWNEREFLRVDWSTNVLHGADAVGLGINFIFDSVRVQAAEWKSNPTDREAFHLERATEVDSDEFEAGEANYLDVTNQWILTPDSITLNFSDGQFTLPTCLLPYKLADCASQTVKVKHAFAKVSPKHDYQPRRWDGRQMELFGIWDVGLNRLTYNRQYGVTNSGFERKAARMNLWKKSYQDDGKTPIPYAERETRVIPYYAESSLLDSETGDMIHPAELFDEGQRIIDSWDDAFRCAAALAQGKRNAEGQCDVNQVNRILYWCHNPVKMEDDASGPKDPTECIGTLKPQVDAKGETVMRGGHPVYMARQGDPRRSTIFWVNQQQDSGPLGYGPGLYDPETGETISGQAYIYGAAVDTYTARSRDLVLLLTGRLSTDDFVSGLNVKDWVSSNLSGAKDSPAPHDMKEIEERAKAMDFEWAKGQVPNLPVDKTSVKAFTQWMKNRAEAMYKSGVYGQNNADLAELRRAKLRDTQLEGMMVTSDHVIAAGGKPGTDWTALSDAEKARVSPLRSQAVRKYVEERMDRMRALGLDFADFADEGMIQRAIILSKDPDVVNMDPEAIRKKLRSEIYYGVTLHEVGHNVGLRHNFRASYDAMNYFDEYWKLREAAAKNPSAKRYAGYDPATGQIKGVSYAGADCNGPKKGTMRARWIDCPGGATSVQEVEGAIREYQYSSIMDYGAEFNSDFWGLGKYDKAAIKFSYAGDGFVEVFTDTKTDSKSKLQMAGLSYFQGSYGFPSVLDFSSNDWVAVNYYQYPNLFKTGIEGFKKRKDVPFSEIVGDPASGTPRQDEDGNWMVPYYFCSDEFAGNLTCRRFDSGADVYEQVTDVISRYENYYIVNNFKRDRYTFYTSAGYYGRIADRYFDYWHTAMTWYTLLRSEWADITGIDKFFTSEEGWGGFTLAVTEGFDALSRVITRPEAGQHSFVTADKTADYPVGYWRQDSDNLEPQGGKKVVPLIDGKFSTTTWDFDTCGYYWGDECQTRIGYFIDKQIAIDMLSQSQAYFTGRDTSTDVRKYAIGYYMPFKKQIQEKFGAILAGDYASYAPRMVQGASGSVSVKQSNWTLNTQPADGASATDIIDPATGFTLQLYAGVYGLSSFLTTFDNEFAETTKIFVVGNGEAPVSDAMLQANGTTSAGQLVSNGGGKEWFLVTDPDSGKTYAAHATPKVQDRASGPTYRNDTGVRMLETWQALLTAGQSSPVKKLAAQKYKQNIDVMRSLHRAMGYANFQTDAPFVY